MREPVVMEVCKQCRRRMGTHQMYKGLADGSIVPDCMFCDECHELWHRFARISVVR